MVTLTHELKAGFKTIYIILYIITLDNNFQGHAGFRNYDNHDWSSPRGCLIILPLGKDELRAGQTRNITHLHCCLFRARELHER